MQTLFRPFESFVSQAVTATGFSNWVRAVSGTCSFVRIYATVAIAGDSISANTAPVYVIISDSTPASGDKAKAQQVPSGSYLEIPVSDTGKVWVCGTNNDTVRVLAMR